MPGTGIEPVQPFGREILSLLCLPISPSGQKAGIIPSLVIKIWPELWLTGTDACFASSRKNGAGEESRTLDLYLGKVSLYQLSYSRIEILEARAGVEPTYTDLQSGA